MPPKTELTKEWIRLVLAGEKRFLKKSQVIEVDPGSWPECGVKHIYEEVSKRSEMKPFMPPKIHKGRTLLKQYFYNVYHSIFPQEVESILRHANEQRNAIDSEARKKDRILVSKENADLLENTNYVS